MKNNGETGCDQYIGDDFVEDDLNTKQKCEAAARKLEEAARKKGYITSNEKIWTTSTAKAKEEDSDNPSKCFYKIDGNQKATLYFNKSPGMKSGSTSHGKTRCTKNEPCICEKVFIAQ